MNNITQRHNAAALIQKKWRDYWQKSSKELPSQKLQRLLALAQEQLNTEGILPLTVGQIHPYKSIDVSKVTSARQINSAVCDSQELKLEHVRALYRVQAQGHSQSSEEMAIYVFLQHLGLGVDLPTVTLQRLVIHLKKAFHNQAGPTRYNPSSPSNRIMACASFTDAVEMAKKLTPQELQEVHNDLSHFLEKPRQLALFKAVMRYAESQKTLPNDPKAWFDCTFSCPPEYPVPNEKELTPQHLELLKILLRTTDLKYIKSPLQTTLKAYSFLNKDQRQLFRSQVTTRSYESLLLLALLLNLPHIEAVDLNFSMTKRGLFNLHPTFMELKVYSDAPHDYPKMCWLNKFEQFERLPSASMRRLIEHADAESLTSSLPAPAKKLLLTRLKSLQSMLKSSTITWRQIVSEMRPDWIKTEKMYEQSAGMIREFGLVWNKTKNPQKLRQDILTLSGESKKINWRALDAYKKQVETLASKLMQEVVPLIDKEINKKFDPNLRRPFLRPEDRKEIKKFIGENCCGPTAIALAFFLKCFGHQAVKKTSFNDHAFIRISTPFGEPLFLDPTYKQLFYRSERATQLFWHHLPPVLVGTRRDFEAFYKQHKSFIKAHEFYWDFNPNDGNEYGYQPTNDFSFFDDKIQQHAWDYYTPSRQGLLESLRKLSTSHMGMAQFRKNYENCTFPLIQDAPTALIDALEPYVRNQLEPLYFIAMKGVSPYSSWEKAAFDTHALIDNDDLKYLLPFCGALLRKAGYEVHWHKTTKSVITNYLRVIDANGEERFVVPAVYSLITANGERHLQMDKVREKAETSPQTFVGTKKAFEQLIDDLITEDAKKQFADNKFHCSDAPALGNLEIDFVQKAMQAPEVMIDEQGILALVSSLCYQNTFHNDPET